MLPAGPELRGDGEFGMLNEPGEELVDNVVAGVTGDELPLWVVVGERAVVPEAVLVDTTATRDGDFIPGELVVGDEVPEELGALTADFSGVIGTIPLQKSFLPKCF